MKSKAAVFACLLLFVSAVVIAEGNQEQQPEKVEAAKENPVEESKQRCRYGCCHYYGYRCARCCGSVAEAQANSNANNNNVQKERESEANPNRWIGGGGHGGWRGGGGGHGGWRGGGGRGGGGK